jgi:hypothetical protein
MTRDYTHEIGKEIRSISGSYKLDGEGTLEVNGRTIVYAVGNALLDSSCCGYWGCRFAVVPGYVTRWKYKHGQEGAAVSAVDSIQDEQLRTYITKLLEQSEGVTQVQFL